VDVWSASNGRLASDPARLYEVWDELLDWYSGAELGEGDPIVRTSLGPPSPAPRQIFAVGLNYRDHVAESGFDVPSHLPPVFTKFVSSLSGPYTTVELPPGGTTDWEVELVAVMARECSHVSEAAAWDYVAGLTVGQDLSERVSQLRPPAPQFALGKSFTGFSPTGPWLVTVDEVESPDDLALGCSVGGEIVQSGRTGSMIFSIPKLISALSKTVTLYPGDLIFTGTPEGVGMGRKPPRFLQPGDTLISWVDGIGQLEQSFIEAIGR